MIFLISLIIGSMMNSTNALFNFLPSSVVS
jgi:hypothetical protein